MTFIRMFHVVLLSLIIGCTNKAEGIPERPSGVPLAAHWVGGVDGGAWILVGSHDIKNHFTVEIYNDYSGSVWAKGVYRLDPGCVSDTVLVASEVQRSITAWTGQSLLLQMVDDSNRYCSLIPALN